VGENLVDDIVVFDTGDELHRPATAGIGLDIDAEHPLEP